MLKFPIEDVAKMVDIARQRLIESEGDPRYAELLKGRTFNEAAIAVVSQMVSGYEELHKQRRRDSSPERRRDASPKRSKNFELSGPIDVQIQLAIPAGKSIRRSFDHDDESNVAISFKTDGVVRAKIVCDAFEKLATVDSTAPGPGQWLKSGDGGWHSLSAMNPLLRGK
jgi:hypothetical protein